MNYLYLKAKHCIRKQIIVSIEQKVPSDVTAPLRTWSAAAPPQMRKCWRNFFSNCILAKCKLGLWWIREESGFCIFAWNTQWNTQCAALLFNLNIPFCCIIEKDYPEKYSQKLWDVHIFHVWGTKFVEMFSFLWNRNIVVSPFLESDFKIPKQQGGIRNLVWMEPMFHWNNSYWCDSVDRGWQSKVWNFK